MDLLSNRTGRQEPREPFGLPIDLCPRPDTGPVLNLPVWWFSRWRRALSRDCGMQLLGKQYFLREFMEFSFARETRAGHLLSELPDFTAVLFVDGIVSFYREISCIRPYVCKGRV